jgi:hypothetical protein
MALQNIRQKGAAVAAVAGLGALLAGCGSNGQSAFAGGVPAASYGATASSAAPMTLACEPNQRAIVRQVLVNGVMQAQAECVSVGSAFAPVAGYGTVPAAPAGAQTIAYSPYGYSQAAIPETRMVQPVYTQPAYTQPVVRRAAPQRVVYQPSREVVAKPKRSVAKSAVIIGSSAGIGAGVGAAVGGKKGAGIGALIGGGGAAIWDQITRRK